MTVSRSVSFILEEEGGISSSRNVKRKKIRKIELKNGLPRDDDVHMAD